jgi:hypothetical protein
LVKAGQVPLAVIASKAKPSTPPLHDGQPSIAEGLDGFASLAMTESAALNP